MKSERPNPWEKIETLRKTVGLVDDDVPLDAVTVEMYAARYKISYKTANDQLALMVRAGQMKEGKKRATCRNGRRVSMKFYWPV